MRCSRSPALRGGGCVLSRAVLGVEFVRGPDLRVDFLRYAFRLFLALAALAVILAACGREAPSTLPIPSGSIAVTSSEPGATILLDGAATGRVTPDTIPDLEVATYRVAVALTAHAPDPAYHDVTVVAYETVDADFTLTLTGVGRIAVTSAPAGATILLDDADTGLVTPDTIPDVLIGEHTVSVALDGYEPDPAERTIDVLEDQVHDADFTLVVPPSPVVLLEEFSNVDCVGCPDMAAVTHALQTTDGYGLDKLLLVNISGTFPDPLDPHYLAAQDAHDARLTYYDAYTGLNFPALMLDGELEYEANLGVDPLTYEDLKASVDVALAGSPGFTVSVQADLAETEIPVTVTLTSVRDVDLSGCALGVYLVEEEIDYPRGAPGTNGQATFHMMLRDYTTGQSPPALLQAGSPVQLTATIQRNLAWDDVMIIAFVQHNASKRIYQAGSATSVLSAADSSQSPSTPSPDRPGGTP